jgi:hypothetical protein
LADTLAKFGLAGGLRLAIFFLMAAILPAAVEWTFWEEFATRFNFIAVDYLVYTHEVIGNIVESYPVAALLSGITALAALLTWLFRERIRAANPPKPQARWRIVYAVSAFVLPWSAGHLADIDQMQFSGNAYANELAGNGLMTFTAAFLRNELDYERFYATLPAAQAQHILGELGIEREPLSKVLQPDRRGGPSIQAHAIQTSPRNVVLISVNLSISSRQFQQPGRFDATPGCTARMLFTRLYAGAVRGLEALSLGTADPRPGIVRRLALTFNNGWRDSAPSGLRDAFPVWRLRLFR